jgi:hypothetical protein
LLYSNGTNYFQSRFWLIIEDHTDGFVFVWLGRSWLEQSSSGFIWYFKSRVLFSRILSLFLIGCMLITFVFPSLIDITMYYHTQLIISHCADMSLSFTKENNKNSIRGSSCNWWSHQYIIFEPNLTKKRLSYKNNIIIIPKHLKRVCQYRPHHACILKHK